MKFLVRCEEVDVLLTFYGEGEYFAIAVVKWQVFV